MLQTLFAHMVARIRKSYQALEKVPEFVRTAESSGPGVMNIRIKVGVGCAVLTGRVSGPEFGLGASRACLSPSGWRS